MARSFRDINGRLFWIVIGGSVALGALTVISLYGALDMDVLGHSVSSIPFYPLVLLWVASVVLAFVKFGRWGVLTLAPLPFFAFPIMIVAMLFAACQAGSCV